MPVFTIGGVDLIPYLESDYRIERTPQYGAESFTDINGVTISDYLGDRISVTVSLRNVPAAKAAAIEKAVNSEKFDMTLSSPAEISAEFRKTQYRAAARSKAMLWDIDLSMESVSLTGGGL